MVDKLPFLSDDHHYAIAAVAARAAQLDAMIEASISILLNSVPKTSKFILKNMNGDKYVGLLEQMILDLSSERGAITAKAFERIKAVRGERNEVLHWLWGKSDDPTIGKYVSQRPHRERQERTKTAKEIQAIADEMLRLTLVISGLLSLAGVLRASPHTPERLGHLDSSVWQEILDRFERGESFQLPQSSSPA
jgi:hypothetical protein